MRSFSTFVAFSLSALAIVASAHDTATGAHKRMLAHRNNEQRDTPNVAPAVPAVKTKRKKRSSCSPHSNTTSTASSAKASPTTVSTTSNSTSSGNSTGLKFPQLGFKMPSEVPSTLDGWWADPSEEYAFVGFSYEISACE